MLRCRLCYSDANPELCENIFNEKLAPPIWRIIAELTQLIIMRDDPYTKIVCLECFDQLKKCDIFRKMILHTDWRIRHETCNYHDNKSIETKTETITIDTEELVENIRNNFNDFDDCVAIKTEVIEEDAGSTNDNECSQDNSCNEMVDDDNSITNDRDERGNYGEGEYSDKTDNRVDIDQNDGKSCTETQITAQMKREDDKSGSNKSTHQCDQCDKTFSTKTNLMFHLKVHKNNDNATDQSSSQDDTNCDKSPTDDHPTEQLNPKYHHCNICKKTFSSKSSLKIHSRVHTGEKPYHCNSCDAKFSLQGNLQTHLRVHTGEKPYHCDNCNVRFSHLVQLQRHQSVHTGEKPYHCHICDKRFRVKHNLTEHLNIHSGEKPYRCEVCNKGFAQTCNLRRHLMTHTGERPFPCDVCGKRFAVRQHLNDHFKIHTGEKPYHCNSCDKRYSTKSHLRRHLKVHDLHN